MRLTDADADAAEESAEVEHGILLGLQPQPQPDLYGADADGVTVTRPSSWWNHLRCGRCGHTFRRGDRVRADLGTRRVEHLVPGLGCAGREDGGVATAEAAEFGAGLLAAWPTDPPVPVHRLPPGDWRIPAGPRDVRDQHVCVLCGHTFRAGEHVIICPCRAAARSAGDGRSLPPACGRAVHRDPAIGLSCWENWRPDGSVPVCPVSQVRVEGG
jgi:hypothetical protein